ncbi:DUF3289 family protein [Serratia marcescens]|uniref:DUF3289 family protein n=1 Tax=Serratia marcescens TaxID=615 RepID=UPI0011E63931|nr:DUF3289 family protein [Serratia marcescens]
MNNAIFPLVIFSSRRQFNDAGTDDMRYGDISSEQLKNMFKFNNVSNVVDPFTMTRLTLFDRPQSRYTSVYGNRPRGKTISLPECTKLLFDEMKVTSLPYAFIGPYKHLINQMLTHFKSSAGRPFKSALLDEAYRSQIVHDTNLYNSTLIGIHQEIDDHIDYATEGYPQDRIPYLTEIINNRILPKFDSLILDKINGLGITVHDVHATRIEILDLVVANDRWHATIKYVAQDHFGLGIEDINKQKYNQWHFFKIWFLLQRCKKFGFRPFFTNMEAVVGIEGGRK